MLEAIRYLTHSLRYPKLLMYWRFVQTTVSDEVWIVTWFIVFILQLLHVSAFTGHRQVEHNIIYKEVIILTTDPLSVVQIVLCALFDKCCRRLFKCDCEVSTRACNHFVFYY
jgi:hypothetical protein